MTKLLVVVALLGLMALASAQVRPVLLFLRTAETHGIVNAQPQWKQAQFSDGYLFFCPLLRPCIGRRHMNELDV